jgi:diacylglycerol kinase (ATP)
MLQAVRACVILNPAAKGHRAGRFCRSLDQIAAGCVILKTSAPGTARQLAAEAVRDGFETIIAAGGDGTLNEVLNGLADAPEGFARVRLGILPLGTVNVFARELGLPLSPGAAWAALQRAHESHMDVGCFEHHSSGGMRRDYFVQLAGAGLDARAIEGVSEPLKRRLGPLAYVLAGLRALLAQPAAITVVAGAQTVSGQLVLIGNGRLYGGPFRLFPGADLRDGQLDVCVFPRANVWTLLRCGGPLLISKQLPEAAVVRLRAGSLKLSAARPTRYEVDGELGGHLPASVSISQQRLRILLPG